MALFRKKADPLSERARALTSEIAALEAQIRQLDNQLHHSPSPSPSPSQPRLRSTARPNHAATPAVHARPPAQDLVFEQVDHDRVKTRADTEMTQGHFNELGVRKFDLAGAWHRLKNNVQGPSANNPKLVNYLAAGSIQGLRPMRYEKRVARNRFWALTTVLLLVLLGIYYVFFVRR